MDEDKECSTTTTRRKSRNRRFATDDTAESVECSGKNCRSCAATMVADCVAVCCCPLALVSLLALAFVKVPYLVGRKCIGRSSRRKRSERKRKKKAAATTIGGADTMPGGGSGEGISGGGSVVISQGKRDIVFEFLEQDQNDKLEERKSFCAAFEADKVLMELYQVGHLGFGRVSFTGIQSFGKGN